MRPRRTASLATALLTALALTLAACGGDDGDSSDAGSSPAPEAPQAGGAGAGDDVDDALEAQTPEARVEVPSEDGATTIAAYVAGGSGAEPASPQEVAQVLAVVGTDADGYITDDAIVVRGSAADATFLCGVADGLDLSAYTVIPVLPDGTGVDCG